MFSKEDHEFIDFLFGKLTCLTDTEMIDLQDDDSCDRICLGNECLREEINDTDRVGELHGVGCLV